MQKNPDTLEWCKPLVTTSGLYSAQYSQYTSVSFAVYTMLYIFEVITFCVWLSWTQNCHIIDDQHTRVTVQHYKP